jgi:hypothetical protein
MEEVRVTVLLPMDIELHWLTVAPWIVQAVGEGVDDTDMKYIKQQALAGAAQIWVVRKKDIEAVLVTEAAFYGGRRTLILRWLCGKRIDEWAAILEAVELWAYENQFERVEAWGRKGWEKVLRPLQYTHEFTVLGKSLARRMH